MAWKNSIHVVQTDADPPNHGRIIFPIKGCTWNNKNALKNIVRPY
jgi:hypothetical protein